MKTKLLTICLLSLTILAGCSPIVILPSCDDSIPISQWHDCSGKYVEEDIGSYYGDWKHGEWNGKGRFEDIEGNKYIGEFKNYKRHGQGAYTFADGEKYVGGWQNDMEHGQGTHTYPNGEKYVGEFKNGQEHGQGTITYVDGEKYVGEFKNGQEHGQGTFTFPNGEKIVGGWKNGIEHGQGTYTLLNEKYTFLNKEKKYYEIERTEWRKRAKKIRDDIKFGRGVERAEKKKRDKKIGDIINKRKSKTKVVDLSNKKAKIENQNDSTKINKSKKSEDKNNDYILKAANKLANMSTLFIDKELNYWSSFSEKKFLDNSILNTKKYNSYKRCEGKDVKKYSSCYGIYLMTKSNLIYRGTFLNGKFDGLGYLISSDNVSDPELGIPDINDKSGKIEFVYYGEFSKGKYHGLGNYYLVDDFTYTGEYKNMAIDGFGQLWQDKLKALYIGYFKNNKKNGHGTLQYKNGNKYVGEWRDDMFHGQGTYTYANGDKYAGEYKNGKYVDK